MTKAENERLAVVETFVSTTLHEMRQGFKDNREEHRVLFAEVGGFKGFKGKMIGGALVAGAIIAAVATAIPFLVG